jgi:hypothetical protein
MSKVVRAFALAVPLVLMTAGTALAQSYPPSPATDVRGLQGGADAQADAAGTAFTGAPSIGIGTMLMAALLVMGLASLYLGWRRAARLGDTR